MSKDSVNIFSKYAKSFIQFAIDLRIKMDNIPTRSNIRSLSSKTELKYCILLKIESNRLEFLSCIYNFTEFSSSTASSVILEIMYKSAQHSMKEHGFTSSKSLINLGFLQFDTIIALYGLMKFSIMELGKFTLKYGVME